MVLPRMHLRSQHIGWCCIDRLSRQPLPVRCVLGACSLSDYELDLTEKPSDCKHAKDYGKNDYSFPTRFHVRILAKRPLYVPINAETGQAESSQKPDVR